jgi:hypothetical protein
VAMRHSPPHASTQHNNNNKWLVKLVTHPNAITRCNKDEIMASILYLPLHHQIMTSWLSTIMTNKMKTLTHSLTHSPRRTRQSTSGGIQRWAKMATWNAWQMTRASRHQGNSWHFPEIQIRQSCLLGYFP